MPKRLQRKRQAGYSLKALSTNYAVVSRPGQFGNPFEVRKHGRAEAVALYRRWLGGEHFPEVTHPRPTADELAGLRGKDLACYCSTDGPCHADILLEWANSDG